MAVIFNVFPLILLETPSLALITNLFKTLLLSFKLIVSPTFIVIFELLKLLEGYTVYVSEGFEFENCESIILSEGRKKGNVSGTVKKDAVKEVLNICC